MKVVSQDNLAYILEKLKATNFNSIVDVDSLPTITTKNKNLILRYNDDLYISNAAGTAWEIITLDAVTVSDTEPTNGSHIWIDTSEDVGTDYVQPVGDTLPVGAIVDYDGTEAPANWEEVEQVEVALQADTPKNKEEIWFNVGRKNLFNPADFNGDSLDGVQLSVVNDNVYMNGTANSLTNSYVIFDDLENGETYTVSANASSTNELIIFIRSYKDGTNTYDAYEELWNGLNSYTFTADLSKFDSIQVQIRTTTGITYNNYPLNIQIEKGLTATEWVPYSKISKKLSILNSSGEYENFYDAGTINDLFNQISKNPVGEYILWEGNYYGTENGSYHNLGIRYSIIEEIDDKFPLKEGFTRKYDLCMEYTNTHIPDSYLYLRFSDYDFENPETPGAVLSGEDFAFADRWGSIADGIRAISINKDIDISRLTPVNYHAWIQVSPLFGSGAQFRIYKIYLLVYDELNLE